MVETPSYGRQTSPRDKDLAQFITTLLQCGLKTMEEVFLEAQH